MNLSVDAYNEAHQGWIGRHRLNLNVVHTPWTGPEPVDQLIEDLALFHLNHQLDGAVAAIPHLAADTAI